MSADLYEKRAAADLRALLDRYGLRSPVGLYQYDAIRTDLGRVIAAAQVLGQEYIGIPTLPPAVRSSRSAYQGLASQFDQWGARVKDAGLTLAYHNHGFEFETLGGNSPVYDILLERTNPDLVAFELDLYWINKAGHDPVSYIERFPGRFHLFHLKDSTAAPAKDFAPVGEGVLDFRRILSYARTAGLRYSFVEHDNPQNPLQSIQTSYATLAGMLPRS
jgi:sugar phosphate isomerase/epimerase